ncbi:hypothetical protein GCM10027275_22300 [Rhabdobacter roseus]
MGPDTRSEPLFILYKELITSKRKPRAFWDSAKLWANKWGGAKGGMAFITVSEVYITSNEN